MGDANKDSKQPTNPKNRPTDKEIKDYFSSTSLIPSYCASIAIAGINSKTNLGVYGIVGFDQDTIQKELREQNRKLASSDLSRVESMLMDQAHTLQALNTHFLLRLSTAENLNQVETYSKIALKSQNQCRQTLATLAELKNPRRTTFVKQQNNAVNQQINQDAANQPKKPRKLANKLLENEKHERLDIGTSKNAGGTNQEMETMEAIYRSGNKGRQS